MLRLDLPLDCVQHRKENITQIGTLTKAHVTVALSQKKFPSCSIALSQKKIPVVPKDVVNWLAEARPHSTPTKVLRVTCRPCPKQSTATHNYVYLHYTAMALKGPSK